MYFRTDALSLIRYDFKERASRYVLLTRELGKIEARMEGAKNIHSKLSPKAEPVSLLDVYLVKGKLGYKLIQVESVKRFEFSSPEQWSFAFHFIESLIRLLPEEVSEETIFSLAQDLFSYLASGQTIHRGLWGYVYLRVLSELGYFPGNLMVDQQQRETASALLSTPFDRGIVEMESNELLIAFILQTVRELLQTENKSSGFLKEVMNHEARNT